MGFDAVGYDKGETPMTDYQFQRYEEERGKREALERKLGQILPTLRESRDLPEAIAKVEGLLGGKA